MRLFQAMKAIFLMAGDELRKPSSSRCSRELMKGPPLCSSWGGATVTMETRGNNKTEDTPPPGAYLPQQLDEQRPELQHVGLVLRQEELLQLRDQLLETMKMKKTIKKLKKTTKSSASRHTDTHR